MERFTIQRKMIMESIIKYGHATVKDIIKDLNDNDFPISVATVYRNLEALEDSNLIQRISLNLKEDYYEITQRDHDHFVCTQCHQIYDVPKKNRFESFKDEDGNLVSSRSVTYYGICHECCDKGKC